jgi:putative DNA primase/helicase
MTPRRPTFEELNAAALARFDSIMGLLGLAGGKRQGHEYLPLNPRRADHKPGSFSINTTTGAWADFADDARGGDLVSLAAYIRHEGNGEAARWLGEVLGYGSGEPAKPTPQTRAPEAPAGEWVHPIPEDAPKPPAGNTKHGKPSQVWTYRDAAGAVLFHVCRFDPRGQKKQFSPLILWRDKGGRLAWTWKWPPAPVPLYGLPSLAAHPEAPAVICEGEKAADAAAVLFPGHPVLSWCGGAGAVNKADLSPLAGREVWVWPDADEAGEQAARKLIFRLREAGAGTIKRLNLDLLGQRPVIDAQGNAGLVQSAPLESGDDAADLLAESWTAAHMGLLLQSPDFLNTQAPPEPEKSPVGDPGEYVSPSGNFRMIPDGLQRWTPPTNDRAGYWKTLCPAFDVLALVRDPEGAGWGLLIELHDPDKRRHRIIVPHRTLKGDGAAALELFLDRGLVPRKGGDGALIEFLREIKPERRARVTNRIGWHGDCESAVYVLPEKTFGAVPGEVWLYEPEGPRLNPFKTRGTLAEWRENVAQLCAGNSRLLFVVSGAFAAPLLHPMGAESGGINFVGASSGGKTTMLKVGSSAVGSPDYLERLRATDNGLEAVFLGKSDAAAYLDEMGQLGPQIAGEAVYMAANGQDKARGARNGGSRKRNTWRTLFFLSSEVSLAGHMGEAGRAPKAGQQTRLADVPADAGAGLGVFEDLHLYASGHEFAQALSRACARYHGTPFEAFLSRLMNARGAGLVDKLREQIRRFERDHLTDSAEGQARRVAARFGLIGAAGELAADWLELPWQRGEAMEAAGKLFAIWLASRGGEGNAEERAMLAQVRDFLTRHGEARFTDWDRPASDTDAHAPRVINRAGFRRITFETSGKPPEDQQTEFLIFPSVWTGEVCKGHDPAVVARLLIKRCALRPSEDNRPSRSLTLPGEGKRRVYHVTPAIWAGEQ